MGWPTPDTLFVPKSEEPGTPGRGGSLADWHDAGWPLRPNGTLAMPVGVFLISSLDRLVLIDCGYGELRPPQLTGPSLTESLTRLSVSPEDITDVVLTHLHIDHIGGASREGKPTFPRAVYRCHAADWHHFVAVSGDLSDVAGRDVARRVLEPIEERFEMWHAAEQIAPGVDVEPVGGHTPGSTIIGIGQGSARRLLLGDLVHHPVQLVDERWRRGPDMDPRTARAVTAEVVADIVSTETPVVGAHFPGLQWGSVARDASGQLRWRPRPPRDDP